MPLHRPPPPEVASKPSPGPSSPADLSADLAIDLRTLQRTVTFYRTYRHPPTLEGLSWAHYRILMQLQDPDERAFYEQLARIDAPPRDTQRGAAGRRYVRKQLAA